MPPAHASVSSAPRTRRLDRIAIGLSGLCILHCLVTAVLATAAVSLAGVLLNPIIHEIGLMLALALGLFALGRGYLIHRDPLPAAVGGTGLVMMATALALGHRADLLAIAGVAVLAFGHALNSRRTR